MSDQILSQEEIDALLGAMQRGEVDLDSEEKKEKEEIKAYDLTTQSAILRDQFYALEEVNDKFTHLLRDTITTNLQRSINVEFVSTEMVKFGEFLEGFSNPTSFNIFSMEPLIGSALLVIEPGLVFSLIDCMFGGDGKPFTHVRDFTVIEQRMMRKFSSSVLINFEKAWAVVDSIKNTFKKAETKPEFVHIVSPNDLVIILVFCLKGKEFSGNIHLCIPYLMLEPIKDKLSFTYQREKDVESTWSRQIQKLIRGTQVTVVAELGSTVNTVRDILTLGVDDILKLNKGPQDYVTLKVEQTPKYFGIPGIIKGNRAVELTKAIRNSRERNKHGEY